MTVFISYRIGSAYYICKEKHDKDLLKYAYANLHSDVCEGFETSRIRGEVGKFFFKVNKFILGGNPNVVVMNGAFDIVHLNLESGKTLDTDPTDLLSKSEGEVNSDYSTVSERKRDFYRTLKMTETRDPSYFVELGCWP